MTSILAEETFEEQIHSVLASIKGMAGSGYLLLEDGKLFIAEHLYL